MDFRHYVNVTRLAERGKFDMVFLADGLGIWGRDEPAGSLCRSNQNAELEPLTLLSALAPLTEHVGLVATASTTYNEPYHIARKFASLDHISGGRAGWNVVTSWSEAEAKNFNADRQPEHDFRYDRAQEFLKVVDGLWDSWEADAFLHNKQQGIFYDPEKLHTLNHKGRHFSVRGPLSIGRSPQGRPIIVQVGASEQARDLAAATADIVFSAQQELGAARTHYTSIKARLANYGRSEDDVKIMPGLVTIVGRTEQEARGKYDALQELVDPLVGLAGIYGQMGDLSAYPLDGPVPELAIPATRSRAHLMLDLARRNNFTIRQLYLEVAAGRGHRQVIGTPTQIVDAMEEWVVQGAADGFNIIPASLPGGIEDFIALIVPELQHRGLFRTEYEGKTFRENLGLREPVNRYRRADQTSARSSAFFTSKSPSS
jgi:alkanesulfonate monooxygenase